MAWNYGAYRIVKYHMPNGDDCYGLHEVDLADEGVWVAHPEPLRIVGETLFDVQRTMAVAMHDAILLPVLIQRPDGTYETPEREAT